MNISTTELALAVSIRLVSPASGDKNVDKSIIISTPVSIRLVSPASGDKKKVKQMSKYKYRFHSISVPSEWGLYDTHDWCFNLTIGFHSISVPSEWGHIFYPRHYKFY